MDIRVTNNQNHRRYLIMDNVGIGYSVFVPSIETNSTTTTTTTTDNNAKQLPQQRDDDSGIETLQAQNPVMEASGEGNLAVLLGFSEDVRYSIHMYRLIIEI